MGAIAGVIGKLVKAEFGKMSALQGTAPEAKGSKRKCNSVDVSKSEPDVTAVAGSSGAYSSSGPPEKAFIRSSRTGVGHVVRFAGLGLHLAQWETSCGWKFATAPHAACAAADVSCSRCRRAM